jgi:predicted nucleic-acid-binding Zn-ribbon protein
MLATIAALFPSVRRLVIAYQGLSREVEQLRKDRYVMNCPRCGSADRAMRTHAGNGTPCCAEYKAPTVTAKRHVLVTCLNDECGYTWLETPRI